MISMKPICYLTMTSLVSCSAVPARNTASLDKIVIPASTQNSSECEAFQKNLPQDLKSGYITAVEKDGQSTREIKIFYYGKWKSNPLVVANGGPGGSSWTTSRDLIPALEREKVEYLFFDQKGTGCSSSYPQLDEQHLAEWKNYSSKGLASDIELLRRKLNLGKKISVFGHSFGAKIALRYAMDFPQSTRSILFYGDSFVASEEDVVQAMVSSLKRRQDFLSERLVNHPNLESTLKSLARKFTSTPCASDERNQISACGYDIIRDLGHYYTSTSADRIERLLFQADNPQTADKALHEIVLKYTAWKLNPTNLLLGYMDYRHFVHGELLCTQTLKEIQIPEWALNSCAIAKHQREFLNRIAKSVRPVLISSQDIFKVLKQHPSIKAYAIESRGDLSSGETKKRESPPTNWIAIELKDVDHASYLNSQKFWDTVHLATH